MAETPRPMTEEEQQEQQLLLQMRVRSMRGVFCDGVIAEVVNGHLRIGFLEVFPDQLPVVRAVIITPVEFLGAIRDTATALIDSLQAAADAPEKEKMN